MEERTQYPEKINVSTGILGDSIAVSLFLNENLTGEVSLNILEEAIDPLITEEKIQMELTKRSLTFNKTGRPLTTPELYEIGSTTNFHRRG